MKKAILATLIASSLTYTYSSTLLAEEVTDTMVVLGRSDYANSIENIAANVTVIGQDEIQSSGAKSLDTLLRSRAGIQVSDTNSGPVFSMRGFSGGQAAHNTLILVDGRKLNKQDLSAPQLSSILLSQVERIEILSGSAGVLYGDQAVGGVINIITKSGTEDGGEISLSAGSFDSRAGSVNVSRKISDTWGLFVSASQDNSDNYREHNRRETGNLLGRVEYKNEDREFFTELSYYDNYRQYAGSLTEQQFKDDPKQENPAYPDDYSHEITRAIRVGYKQAIVDNWKLKTDLFFDKTSGSGIAWGGENTKENSELVGTAQVENRFFSTRGEGSFLFGLDAADRSHDYLSSSTDRDNNQSIYSAYTQLHYPLLNSLTLVTGGRYSLAEDDITDKVKFKNGMKLNDSAEAFELGLNYRISRGHKLYVRGESNFRFADIDEQAYTSPGVNGLKPQTGVSLEAGWAFIQPEYSVKVDIYNLRIEDEIIFDKDAQKPIGGGWAGANVNADESERNGISLAVDYFVIDSILVGAEYHLIKSEFTDGVNKGKKLPWVAENSARTYVNYDISTSWQLFVEGVYTGSHYETSDKQNSKQKQNSYWLTNAAINYSNSDWSASVRVDNLFDESYASSADSDSWSSYYYSGDGRKLMVTGSYQF
ncbi:MAG: TonB-dependent receptor [Aliivibrio sp.]|uniref:TonB-dependent receptor n=1 Tax=Aliivibrio sp. TaxID=1872443 RepID=UPI001A48A477|nr:TonB-dependent receptor [Aliivibrio sp.]